MEHSDGNLFSSASLMHSEIHKKSFNNYSMFSFALSLSLLLAHFPHFHLNCVNVLVCFKDDSYMHTKFSMIFSAEFSFSIFNFQWATVFGTENTSFLLLLCLKSIIFSCYKSTQQQQEYKKRKKEKLFLIQFWKLCEKKGKHQAYI